MQIRMLTTGPLATNAFVLTREGHGDLIVVDCPEGSFARLEELARKENLSLSTVLLTHGHFDHTQDLALFQKAGAKVHAHPADRRLIENPEVMTVMLPPGMDVDPARIDVPLKDGGKHVFLGAEAEIRHVPGHCPGNVLFYFPEFKAAFVGDAIFAGGIGRYDLPGGDFDVLESSIRDKIYSLPDETVIYPGHGPATSVGREKLSNPFVRPVGP